jgi:hypothetical protein
MKNILQVTQGVSPGFGDVVLNIHPEGQYHINDQGRAHSEKSGINKEEADPGGGDAQFVTKGRTNPKGLPFYKIFDLVHISNLF